MKAFRSFSAFYTTQVINKKIAKYTQIMYLKKITCSMIPPGVYTSITLRLLNVRFLSLSLSLLLSRNTRQGIGTILDSNLKLYFMNIFIISYSNHSEDLAIDFSLHFRTISTTQEMSRTVCRLKVLP